jgi:hypothetical protein
MAETAVQNDATIFAGGFRIEIHPDELTVTADRSAVQPKKKSVKKTLFTVFICIFFAFYLLFDVLPSILSSGVDDVVIVSLIVGSLLLWGYLSGSKNLHCTRDNLEVIQVSRGQVRDKWLYPKDAVKNIRFAPVAYSKYRTTCGLVFTVQGKKIKTLRGIESPEAQIVLKQLDRLGFDVVRDVGMPMMVEMALERRNSWLNV